jgi:transaldolase
MKIFIDTANLGEIREAASLGILDGVTTNPTLLSKEKGGFRDILKQICEIVDGPVSAEVVAAEADGMVREARDLASIHDNIVIKVPMSREGMKAVHRLSADGIRTNMTLVFSANQALLASKAGASFVSPFVGRLDDISHIGMDVVGEIVEIYEIYDIETEVIVASVRNPLHVIDAAIAGADAATIPFKVIEQMVNHPLTTIGIERFLSDWKKVQK